MTDPRFDLLSTPIHEAGHVAAAWSLAHDKAIYGPVSVVESTWTHGFASVGLPPPSGERFETSWYDVLDGLPIAASVRDWVETSVMISLAGDVATVRAAKIDRKFELPADGRHAPTPERKALIAAAIAAGETEPDADMDYVKKVLLAVSASPEEADAYRGWLMQRTWQLVSNLRFGLLVDALVPEVTEHKTLEKEEVLAIIHRVVDLPTQQVAASKAWPRESGYIEDD